MSLKKVSIIIPVFNEQDNIRLMIDGLDRALNKIKFDYEIIFINDGSQDKTLYNLERYSWKKSEKKLYALSIWRRS